MSLWNLHQIGEAIGAQIQGEGSAIPSSLSMDTRTLEPGACFVAIRSQRDGHDFAEIAVQKGACALLVDHALDLPIPQLVVDDTLAGLQRWGQNRLEAFRPQAVFGVTGSVGKTSAKELLASATGSWKTPGNRNNALGLPEALATLPEHTAGVVLEMGMSTPGEIRRLTEIAPPDFGLVTMVGTSHVENFPQGQEGIARAKGELVEGLRPGGSWVHLGADPWCRWIALQPWARHARAVAVGDGSAYGWEDAQSLGVQGERFCLRTPEGVLDVRLQLRGAHQVRNASLAGTVSLLAGTDPGGVVRGLGAVEPEPGRGKLHELEAGGWLLDESYNASQDSILACAEALIHLEGGEPVAVLGCIRELGLEAELIHRETGTGLRKLGIQRIWVYGDHAGTLVQGFGAGAVGFPDFQALRDDPRGLSAIPDGARILVKGSRFWQAEKAVAWLLARKKLSPAVPTARVLA